MKILHATLLGLGLYFTSGAAFAFDLTGNGDNLTADGGVHSRFIAIKQGGQPFEVISTTKSLACENDLAFDGVSIGNVADNKGISTVFAGVGDIGFTLHYQTDGSDWQALNSNKIPCHTGQTLRLKATFYRQTDTPMTGTTRVIHKNFNLKDGISTHAVYLNANLNFAKPPTTYTCQLTSASQQTITLKPIKAQDLERYGKIKANQSASFNFNCDATNAKIVAIAYDHNNPSNISTSILSLSSDSTATGVGVELYKDDKAISLHQKPNGVPLFFDDTYLSIDNHQLNIGAGYVKTGEISSGTVKAKAGLVFFYP